VPWGKCSVSRPTSATRPCVNAKKSRSRSVFNRSARRLSAQIWTLKCSITRSCKGPVRGHSRQSSPSPRPVHTVSRCKIGVQFVKSVPLTSSPRLPVSPRAAIARPSLAAWSDSARVELHLTPKHLHLCYRA
jgi:hypothetical protein